MARINHKIAVAGATVIALTGVASAVAYVTAYTNTGSSSATVAAGAPATVDFDAKEFETRMTSLIVGGSATFWVTAKASRSVELVDADLMPDFKIPAGCPAELFTFGSPTPLVPFTEGKAIIKAGVTEVAKVTVTYDRNSLTLNNEPCESGNYELIWGPGPGGTVSAS